MLATVLLLGLLTVASVTDALWHKIYNWTTYTGILAALGLSALGWLLVAVTSVDQRRLEALGWQPVSESVKGLLACGAVMLVCFVMFRGVGGGDVKLVTMVGAFLGLEDGLTAMLLTFVLGGCMGLIVLVWRVGPARLTGRVFRQVVWSLRLRAWSPLSDEERAELRSRLFLAPCALAAVVIVRSPLIDMLR
jgi:prepilin peptidase CpaA